MLLLVQLLALGTACYGAVSDDVYVRKDVFEAKMEAFMTEIRGEFQVMNAKIDALSRRVDDNYHSLEKRIDDLEKRTDDKFINMEKRMDNNYHSLEKRIDDNYYSLDARISDLRNGMYLGLVLFGSYSIVATFAGTPSLILLKSIILNFLLFPPPL